MPKEKDLNELKKSLESLKIRVLEGMLEEETDPLRSWLIYRERARKIANTVDFWLTEAYLEGIKALGPEVKDDAASTFNLEVLNQDTYQTLLGNTMCEYLEKKVAGYYKIKGDLDPLKKDPLMISVLGITSRKIRDLITENRNEYSLDKHKEITRELVNAKRKELYKYAAINLRDEHKTGVIESIQGLDATNFLDADQMTIDNAVEMYDLAEEVPGFCPRLIKEYFLEKGKPIPRYLTVVPQ